MPVPGKYDITFYRGDTFRLTVMLWEDDAKTEPVDLAGATVAAEIRDKAMGKLLVAFGCTVTPPNSIVIELTAAVSGALTGKGVWDLQVTFPGGDVKTFLAGAVTITADVTDSAPAAQALRAVK